MLVVSRRIGEEIMVPQFGLVFRVLDIRGNKVRVGVTAPPEIRVQRRELWERIQAGLASERTAHPASAGLREAPVLTNGAG